MTAPREFAVQVSGRRLDRVVADEIGCGRRAARALIEDGKVRVNGKSRRAATLLEAGDRIEVALAPAARTPAVPGLRVLWERDGLVAVSKPAGVHTHRGKSGPCVADFMESIFGDLSAVGAAPREAGIVHRIDRDTSGLVLAALRPEVYVALRARFSARAVRKHYLALVAGRLETPLALTASLARRGPRTVVAGAHDTPLEARTDVRPLEVGADWSLVEAVMRTGAPHQIRAHLAGAGHPLLGDLAYGGPLLAGARHGQLLHALRAAIDEGPNLAAPATEDFVAAYAALRARTRTR